MSLPGFSVHLAGRHQAKGIGDIADEAGFAFGAQREFDLGNDRALTLIGEVVYLSNADAAADDRWYWTSGAEFTTGAWNLAISHTSRHTDVDGDPGVKDWQSQVSAGYESQAGQLEGIGLNVDPKHVREDGEKSFVLGFVRSKEFEFSSPN